MADHGVPLRIAFLTYRGKPHVGGQGVYTRHLTKALVDLGHHVEVLRRPAVPRCSTSGCRCVELPSLDIYNDHFPMRMPGIWELKTLDRLRRGHRLLDRHLPRAAGLLACGPGTTCATASGDFDLVHDNQCLGYGLLGASSAIGLPVLATIHHPITVDRRLEMEHAETALQAAHAAPLVRLHRDADAGGPPPRAGHHGVGELLRRHRRRPQGRPATACTSCPSASTPSCSGRCPTSSACPAASSPPRSADVAMKGLAFLLEAVAKLRTERDDVAPRRHRPPQGRRRERRAPSSGSASTTHVEFVSGVSDAAHRRAVLRGRAGRRAVALRGLLAAGHRGHGLRRAAGGHHRRRPARGRRHRRRHRPARAARRQPRRSPPSIRRALDDPEPARPRSAPPAASG